MTGITLRHLLPSAGTGIDPGAGRRRTPTSEDRRPFPPAISILARPPPQTDRYAPPSEKESGVTFRIPMTRGMPEKVENPSGSERGTNPIVECGAMTGRPPSGRRPTGAGASGRRGP